MNRCATYARRRPPTSPLSPCDGACSDRSYRNDVPIWTDRVAHLRARCHIHLQGEPAQQVVASAMRAQMGLAASTAVQVPRALSFLLESSRGIPKGVRI